MPKYRSTSARPGIRGAEAVYAHKQYIGKRFPGNDDKSQKKAQQTSRNKRIKISLPKVEF
jgi:hypothetical protein